MGDDHHLMLTPEVGERFPDGQSRLASDPGIDLVEDHRRRRTRKHEAQSEHHAGKLATRCHFAQWRCGGSPRLALRRKFTSSTDSLRRPRRERRARTGLIEEVLLHRSGQATSRLPALHAANRLLGVANQKKLGSFLPSRASPLLARGELVDSLSCHLGRTKGSSARDPPCFGIRRNSS